MFNNCHLSFHIASTHPQRNPTTTSSTAVASRVAPFETINNERLNPSRVEMTKTRFEQQNRHAGSGGIYHQSSVDNKTTSIPASKWINERSNNVIKSNPHSHSSARDDENYYEIGDFQSTNYQVRSIQLFRMF